MVKLAYMNGIHVEEYDLFKRGIGIKYLYDTGIINQSNLIQQDMY